MKNINIDEIDDELLKDLIEKCEDSMASPYKEKAKAKAALIEVKPEENMEVAEEDGDDLDPEKIEELLEHYKQMKG